MGRLLDTVKVVNLTDVYLTREEHNRVTLKMQKKIGQCAGGLFALSILTGLLLAAVVEQNKQIEDLEERLNKKDETAG